MPLSEIEWKRANVRKEGACSRCQRKLLPGQASVRVSSSYVCQRCWTEVCKQHAELPMPALLRELGIGRVTTGQSRRTSPMRRAATGASRTPTAGPNGAQVVADLLDQATATKPAAVLHGVSISGKPAPVDHIVVSAAGVTVVDSKNYWGDVEVIGYLGFTSQSNPPSLKINNRIADDLISDLAQTTAHIEQAVVESRFEFDVPVSGAICFDDRGLAKTDCREIRGVQLAGPKRVAAYVTRSGGLTAEQINEVSSALKRALQPR